MAGKEKKELVAKPAKTTDATPKRELAVKESPNEIDSFISQAIAVNAPVETLERLFALHKEVKAEKAKELFITAMAKLQSELPIIEKTKVVKDKAGVERYRFAQFDSIIRQTKEIISANGFSYRFREEADGDILRAVCIVTHEAGHSEESPFTVNIGVEAYMTDVQKRGARMTFAKRYAFCNAFGIVTGDEDIDGTDADKKDEPKSDKAKIAIALNELGLKLSGDKLVEKVKELTQLDPTDGKNLPDIVARLNILVQEKKEGEIEYQEVQ
jgi:hypothetical protein